MPSTLMQKSRLLVQGGLLLALAAGLLAGGCSTMAPLTPAAVPATETGDILQMCSVVPDRELQDIRGTYQSYYFAMDVGINLTTSKPSFTVTYTANVPDGQAPSFEGNMVSFNNGQVSFQAGVGDTSLGKGIYSVVSVAGSENIVIANTNVNINIPNAGSLIPSISILPAPTLGGIK
jgi:hypothetical protein